MDKKLSSSLRAMIDLICVLLVFSILGILLSVAIGISALVGANKTITTVHDHTQNSVTSSYIVK